MSVPTVRLRLRVAAEEAAREAVIAAWLRDCGERAPPARRAILAEGVIFDRDGPQGVPLVGLTAGCPCCVGAVALRVALGRTLRRLRPDSLLLVLATADHLPRLRRLLESGELGVAFEIEG